MSFCRVVCGYRGRANSGTSWRYCELKAKAATASLRLKYSLASENRVNIWTYLWKLRGLSPNQGPLSVPNPVASDHLACNEKGPFIHSDKGSSDSEF